MIIPQRQTSLHPPTEKAAHISGIPKVDMIPDAKISAVFPGGFWPR